MKKGEHCEGRTGSVGYDTNEVTEREDWRNRRGIMTGKWEGNVTRKREENGTRKLGRECDWEMGRECDWEKGRERD